MLDPGIKEESGYAPFDSGCENDVWVLQADGKPYSGRQKDNHEPYRKI